LFRAGEERPRPLRVVSYNVLAQSLLNQTPQLYSNCSANALDAGLRRQRLVHLISNLDADIVALQEVEDFDNGLAAALASIGLSGAFKKRTGTPTDGVAIFFRSSRLALLNKEEVEYRRLADSVPAHMADKARKDNVALVLHLRDEAAGHELLACCTHILWNPKRGLVKLWQIDCLLRHVAQARDRTGAAVLLMGDFNCVPHSLLYRFLCGQNVCTPEATEGTWDGMYGSQRSYSPQRPKGGSHGLVELAAPPLTKLLRSAYAQIGEPPCTTSHRGFTGTVDYVWFEASRFKLAGMLPVLSAQKIQSLRGLPTSDQPSDHIPIGCELIWTCEQMADGQAPDAGSLRGQPS